MKFVGYGRRSTQHQSCSLGRQRIEVERYVAEQGGVLVAWYEDTCPSACHPGQRQGFLEAFARARAEDAGIVVSEISRITRSGLGSASEVRDALSAAGVELFDASMSSASVSELRAGAEALFVQYFKAELSRSGVLDLLEDAAVNANLEWRLDYEDVLKKLGVCSLQ